MANPLLTKILSKIAIDLAVEKDKRKKILTIIGIILSPILVLLLLIAMILYIITSPLTLLVNFFTGNQLEIVEQIKQDYEYNTEVGIYEQDYLQSGNQDYNDITFENTEIPVVYFNQFDKRWADKLYGVDKISTHGCGPTAMAIVISSLTEHKINPIEMCKWSFDNGYYAKGNGSYHSLIPKSAESFGLKVSSIDISNPQGIVTKLSEGKLVVALMAKGHFTDSGHFIVLRGITEEGKILVADPASFKRSEKEWDLEIIVNEARKGAGAGGPFWAISK